MRVGEALLRSPASLAALLEAAGKVGLERTGTILELRVPVAPDRVLRGGRSSGPLAFLKIYTRFFPRFTFLQR